MLESVPRFLVLSESMLLLSGFDCIFFYLVLQELGIFIYQIDQEII